MSPLVSICIPAWERPALVLATVQSCLAQTYTDIEVVVADDSRSNAVANALAELRNEPRLRYTRNAERLGQAENVNRLFDLARGERLVLLHDDDLLLPDAIETLDACWHEHPGLIASYGKHYFISHSGTVLSALTEDANRSCRRISAEAGLQARPLWSALVGQFPADAFMVRTSTARLTRLRGYEHVGDACDFDFKLRFAEQPGLFYFVDRYVSKYRITDRSVSSEQDSVDHAFLIAHRLVVPPELEATRAYFLRSRMAYTARRYMLIGQRRTAWRLVSQREYWRPGFLSAAHATNVVLFLLPTRALLALLWAKRVMGTFVRRNDFVYRALLSIRYLWAATLRGTEDTKG